MTEGESEGGGEGGRRTASEGESEGGRRMEKVRVRVDDGRRE